tara:strand:- start:112 stop:378 length:267 start_codon:yes stop_codon:yes gene_type:complete
MSNNPTKMNHGPFAEAESAAHSFCHNLFLSNAMHQCIKQLTKLQEEYQNAVLKFDEELAASKKLQLQSFEASLTLTAHIFDEVDEISA